MLDRIAAEPIATSGDLTHLMSGREVHDVLVDKVSGLAQVQAIAIINAEGKVINGSRQWPAPDFDVADRDYFRALRDSPSLLSFISSPTRSRNTGRWNVYLARRVTNAEGDFIGVILGSLKLSSSRNSSAPSRSAPAARFRSTATTPRCWCALSASACQHRPPLRRRPEGPRRAATSGDDALFRQDRRARTASSPPPHRLRTLPALRLGRARHRFRACRLWSERGCSSPPAARSCLRNAAVVVFSVAQQ